MRHRFSLVFLFVTSSACGGIASSPEPSPVPTSEPSPAGGARPPAAEADEAPPTAYGDVRLVQLSGARNVAANAIAIAGFLDDPAAAAFYAPGESGCSVADRPGRAFPAVSAGDVRFEIGGPPPAHVLSLDEEEGGWSSSKQLWELESGGATEGLFESSHALRLVATGADVPAFEASLSTAEYVEMERPKGGVFRVPAGEPLRLEWRRGSNDVAWVTLGNRARTVICRYDARSRVVEVPAAAVAEIADGVGADEPLATLALEVGREVRVRAGRFDVRVRSVFDLGKSSVELVR